jgi:hypothetical protein
MSIMKRNLQKKENAVAGTICRRHHQIGYCPEAEDMICPDCGYTMALQEAAACLCDRCSRVVGRASHQGSNEFDRQFLNVLDAELDRANVIQALQRALNVITKK